MIVNICDRQDSLFNEESIFKNIFFTIFTIVSFFTATFYCRKDLRGGAKCMQRFERGWGY